MNLERLAEQDVNWAYKVLDAVIECLDRAAAKPELAVGVTYDLIKNLPEIFDALMVMTKPEHREIVYRLVKASARAAGEWMKKSQ